MRIHSVKLENFRGFKSFEQELSPRLNVFIGKNGSGKTSILDAIGMNINIGYLRNISVHVEPFEYSTKKVNFDDINSESSHTNISLKYETNQKIYKEEIKLIRTSEVFDFGYNDFIGYFDGFHSKLSLTTNFPLLSYYNSEKILSEDLAITPSKFKYPQINAYSSLESLIPFSFKLFSSWFRQQEDIENEIRLKSDQTYKLPNLQIIRSAIIGFFNNLGNDTYNELSVIRAKPHKNESFNFNIRAGGELFIKKNEYFLKVSQLSTGEKNILLTVADIASRIAQLNPSLENPLQNASGIVLIDEIEQHLHPTWQRKVIGALIKTFPNIQFILTTHSENVIISILDLVKEKELLPADVSVINLKPANDTIESEKLEINDHGQIEGGLSSFYEDQLEDIDRFFNI